jgi:DNA-binding transcriptional MerR regulator
MDDLERLQQIMFFRELGLDLRAIKDILSSPDFDRRSALLRHKELLVAKEERIRRLIRSIDRTLDSIERGIPMGEKDLFAGFDQTKYEEEARQRWGGSKEYEESVRKVSEYTKEDWVAIQTET